MSTQANTEIKGVMLKDGLTTQWLVCGKDEGMLLSEVAKLLGVSTTNIKGIVRRRKLPKGTLSTVQKANLRKDNVISMYARTKYLIPRDTIDALVKIVDTPEAWARYKEVLEMVREPKKLVEVHAEAGEEHLSMYLEKFVDAVMSKMNNKIDSRMSEIMAKLDKALESRITPKPKETKRSKNSVGHMLQEIDKHYDEFIGDDFEWIANMKEAYSKNTWLSSRQYQTVLRLYRKIN